ncbi:hypothetical protein KGF56_004449 [Candida oxycetoniae]|uniref:PCI domain-containing protein n=1 Tax=Candida oxycetoniae TaxID=497107 RepID=A0AAI9STV0_9ASCO|nr:uncharacterized protein KGF56_004449 [Candida oxycetoniae]KAI3402775.2 hypothetical protein KGF56_004449 [Candida oxycetoniae]
MSVTNLVQEINQTFSNGNNDQKFRVFSKVLSVDPSENEYTISIYNSVSGLSQVSSNIKTAYDDDWLALNAVVSSFVRICVEMDPWSVLKSFDLYATYLNDLSVAFNNNAYGWLLSGVIKSTIRLVLPWALKLDRQMFYKEEGGKYRLGYMAGVLLKIFNNIRINDSSTYKKSIILYLGNKLCYTYWKLDNPLLCQNIFSNMNNTSLKLEEFPHGEKLKYRYFLAKYYFVKYELVECFKHLEWCLVNTSSKKNQKLIIELLLPIGLILGKKPNFKTLSVVQDEEVLTLLELYESMFYSVASGDYESFRNIINHKEQYFKDKNLLLLLNRMDVLVFRNLVKNVWRIMNRPTSLSLEIVPIHGKDTLFKENLLVTLIDSNLIKGKLTTGKVLVLSKNDPFPNVFNIYTKRFGAQQQQGKDWM